MKYTILALALLATSCGDGPTAPTGPATVTQIVPGRQPDPGEYRVSEPFCAKYPGYDFCAEYCRTHPCNAISDQHTP